MNAPAIREETNSERLERETIGAVMAAIEYGFNGSSKGLNVKQVADACVIIVSFLKSCEAAQTPRSVTQWREAVENLKITLGSK